MEVEPLNNSIQVNEVEKEMLGMDQVDCPVLHHFGPGIYIREVLLPADTFAIGHRQKEDHLNIMLTGKVAIIDEGKVKVLTAPLIFTGKPGRKMGYIMEACSWLNIYNTNETDIEKLEETYLDKSEVFLNHEETMKPVKRASREEDRQDYLKLLNELGTSEELVRSQSENEGDQIPFPAEWITHIAVRNSDIEGKGLFLSLSTPKETPIAPGRIDGKRTPAGRYVNHSKRPNCKYIKSDNNDIYLISLVAINGCIGGDHGTELTVDYRQALSIHEVKTCQV